MNIEDYKLEIAALQKKDTEDAIASGFTDKKKWFEYMMKQDHDEVANAILDIAKRYELSEGTVAYNFDPTMVMRLGKIVKNTKTTKF